MVVRPYRKGDREAILAMEKSQFTEWFGSYDDAMLLDPNDPLAAFVLVIEDEGRVIAALAAKRTVEIITTMDASDVSLATLFWKGLIPMWSKAVVMLHKLGYEDASVRVGGHLKKWQNTLIKRGGFVREPFSVLRFDIKKACSVQK